ncbi:MULTISPECIES: hypothetical protein [unclassified Aureimonas]|uniref:hypothetical protein n=1 Tax=unclassified Aureimonas TaxID=2615206 RepID=UPI00070F0449|nr:MULTISPECIES: hypothetical protein [unclassified Aureimonas]KQT58711.1 hypothetical protein ASG62_24490 [Aureimonas sp. Leaf427]
MKRRWSCLTVFVIAIFLYGAAVLVADAYIGVFFETNDDVASMMYAHGFGLGYEPSPLLLFSNIWLGRLILWIGAPFDRWSYGLVLLGAQVLSMATIATSLRRLNGMTGLTLLLVGMAGLRGLMAPQFTIVAGFCAIAAVCLLLAYARRPQGLLPPTAAVFVLFGSLIRAEMVAMVLLVAIPFLLQWSLLRSGRAWVAGLVAASLYYLAAFDHFSALASPEWEDFRDLNLLRAAITDFGMGSELIANAQARSAGGLSLNDALLLSSWWFLDPGMTKPEALRAAIATAGAHRSFLLNADRLGALWSDFLAPSMLAISALAIALAAVTRQVRARWLAALGIFLLLALLITAAGRTTISRVYFPLLVLLACVPLAVVPDRRSTGRVAAWVGLAAGIATVFGVGAMANTKARNAASATVSLASLDSDRLYLVWAANLPFEGLYRPLERREDMPQQRFFGIGTHQRSPLALAHFGGDIDNLLAAYRSASGLSFITWPGARDLLATYCSERLDSRQVVIEELSLPGIFVGTYSCPR